MNSPATLRTETGALCLDIERLEQQLKAKTIAFDTGRQLWDSAYRPKARILAEAMLPYVPTGDPRIHVEFEAGDFRKIKSDAVNCIEAPFLEGTAVAHLGTVVKQLRGLTNYLPTAVEA